MNITYWQRNCRFRYFRHAIGLDILCSSICYLLHCDCSDPIFGILRITVVFGVQYYHVDIFIIVRIHGY